MINKSFYITILILLVSCIGWSQTKNDSIPKAKPIDGVVIKDSLTTRVIDPLSPSKAAFYSAILPGLGQAYNKRYWKIPIVYAALGTTIYFYVTNDKEYDRYRDAYKRRLAGFTDDEFYGVDANGNPLATPRVSRDGLIRAQDTFRRNKELSLLLAIGFYALNIIDANVDAHLLQYNVDENLALKPHFKYNQRDATTDLGVTLNFKF